MVNPVPKRSVVPGFTELYRYNESIMLFKSPQDAPWHASALEGLATIPVVEAWSSTHGIVRAVTNSFPLSNC